MKKVFFLKHAPLKGSGEYSVIYGSALEKYSTTCATSMLK